MVNPRRRSLKAHFVVYNTAVLLSRCESGVESFLFSFGLLFTSSQHNTRARFRIEFLPSTHVTAITAAAHCITRFDTERPRVSLGESRRVRSRSHRVLSGADRFGRADGSQPRDSQSSSSPCRVACLCEARVRAAGAPCAAMILRRITGATACCSARQRHRRRRPARSWTVT
jgi:hypothetical protein